MEEIRESGTWGSSLSTAEFAAIRSVGFEPVGQVLGAAVYNIGYTGGYSCPGAWAGYGGFVTPAASVTSVSGATSMGSFGPMVATLYEARRTAIGRMVAECQELGGHGIVGVRLTIGSFPAGGLEFKAIGTAVRAPGEVSLPRAVHLGPVGPGLREADAVGLGAGGPGAGHLDRVPARRLADDHADALDER